MKEKRVVKQCNRNSTNNDYKLNINRYFYVKLAHSQKYGCCV